MYVLGTAGHIDHGKSVLVHALTGIDPDRLREEKERGMTIDLGFAWFQLPSGREVGVVDVPGHERFIKNMLAGVSGIDLVLLIIAANEGVMPQTREHLAILDLLGVQKGIVVITKKDLMDDELLDLVRMEIEEIIVNTTLSNASVVAVSAQTGEGLEKLVLEIDKLLETTESRKDTGHPRLPIDRVFTIAGSGTVITGTLIDGSLSTGQEVEIVPVGLKSRLRGLQTHKSRVNTASPGSRVAANLVGVNTSQLQRGDVLTTPGWLKPTTLLVVKLHLLPYIQHRIIYHAFVSFHTGASEVMAKVRLLEGDELNPGETTWAQLLLDKSIVVINGDRFIIRSPMETLGGGEIVDSRAKRLRRFSADVIQNLTAREKGTAEEIVIALLEKPLELSALLARGKLSADEIRSAVDSLLGQNKIVAIGDGEHRLLWSSADWQKLTQKVGEILSEYHRRFPARPGMPKVELGSRLKFRPYVAVTFKELVDREVVVECGAVVHLPTHRINLSPTQKADIDTFLQSLEHSPFNPPGESIPEPDLLNMLIEQGKVVKVCESVVFSASAYSQMLKKVTSYLKEHGKVSLAEVRDMFQNSRKYAQAFLEHLDGKRVTRRIGDERVLY